MLSRFVHNFFKPQQDIFYVLLLRQADYMVEATEMMMSYLDKPGKKRRKKARRLEKAADDVRRRLVKELNRTFVTPLDREDIHALSRNLDDVVDYAYTTTEEMELFQIKATDSLHELAMMLHEGSVELRQGVYHLPTNLTEADRCAQRAKKIETHVEQVYRKALADLFVPPDDMAGMMKILKLREVYRHLSNAADRVDEAASHLSDMAVKMA
ncbi:MAG: DUF47 family protein [Chloroflexota bacterium]|jgi:uncharacterized protein